MKEPDLDLWSEPTPFQNVQAYEQKNHNWAVLRNYGQYIGNYIKGITDSWDVRFAAQLNQVKQPDEVIDARVDAWGKTYPNLRSHIINIETSTVEAMDNPLPDSSLAYALAIILKVKDLTTSSYPLRYQSAGTVSFNLPQGAMNTTEISKLMIAQD